MSEKATTYKLGLFKKRGPRILIFGAPKVGKTCFAMGWPNPTIVDYDGRIAETLSLAKLMDIDIPESSILQNPSFTEVTNLLEKAQGWDQTKTLVFDGLSSWSEVEIREILKGGKTKTRTDGSPGVETYTQRVSHLTDILLGCQLLKCNVIAIAHEELVREYEDVTDFNERLPGGAILRVPFVPGKNMGAMLGKYFDFVFYAKRGGARAKPKFEIVTESTGEIRCGGTLPLFKPVEEMESVTVKFGESGKRVLPRFSAYSLFRERLEAMNAGVELTGETQEIEKEN